MNIFKRVHQKLLKDIENGKRVSPLKAIRSFCLECVGFNHTEVEKCSVHEEYSCPLYKYRFGRNDTGRKISHRTSDEKSGASRLKVKSKEVI